MCESSWISCDDGQECLWSLGLAEWRIAIGGNLDLFDMSPHPNKCLLGEHLLHPQKWHTSSWGVCSSAVLFCAYILPGGDFLGSGNFLFLSSVNSLLCNLPLFLFFFFWKNDCYVLIFLCSYFLIANIHLLCAGIHFLFPLTDVPQMNFVLYCQNPVKPL